MRTVIAFIKRQLVNALAWVICFEARKGGRSKAEMRSLVLRELSGVQENIEAYASWLSSERAVLEARLNRRFDLGMALNESANRVIEAKKLAREPNPDNLTGQQKAALEFQKQFLQRNAERS